MDKMSLYNKDSIEFSELIDKSKVNLKKHNSEYRKLIKSSLKILNDFPNLKALFEDDIVENLNKKECKMLQKLFVLHMKIRNYEEQEIFFLGSKEFYLYLKNMAVI